MIETHDSEGALITPGCEVAYNRSGDVVRGTVLKVGKPVQRSQWYTKYSIKIQGPDGRVSHVRNNRSVLVIGWAE